MGGGGARIFFRGGRGGETPPSDPSACPRRPVIFNVTDRYIRRLVGEQRIAYFKVGRLLRFAAVDLDAYLAACRVEPAASHWLVRQRASRS